MNESVTINLERYENLKQEIEDLREDLGYYEGLYDAIKELSKKGLYRNMVTIDAGDLENLFGEYYSMAKVVSGICFNDVVLKYEIV